MPVPTDAEKVERRERGIPPQHDRLTALETTLLRALYTVGCSWTGEGAKEVCDDLVDSGDFSDENCALLEQLLEEERADRFA